MFRRRKKIGGNRRAKMSGEMDLQITSMADIFTILLVFLLKSYATSAVDINPAKGLALPEANAAENPVEALKVEVSETGVSVEGLPVMGLIHYAFGAGDLLPNGASKTLGDTFEKERKRQILIAQSNSQVQIDPKIIVIADQHVPYSTIKTVLASAAIQGYTDFKMAVVKGE